MDGPHVQFNQWGEQDFFHNGHNHTGNHWDDREFDRQASRQEQDYYFEDRMLFHYNTLTKRICDSEASHEYSQVNVSKDILKFLKTGLAGLLRNGYMESEHQFLWDEQLITLSDILHKHERLQAEVLEDLKIKGLR